MPRPPQRGSFRPGAGADPGKQRLDRVGCLLEAGNDIGASGPAALIVSELDWLALIVPKNIRDETPVAPPPKPPPRPSVEDRSLAGGILRKIGDGLFEC